MYRVLISIPLFQNKTLRGKAALIASISSAVVNLILIMSLGKVYEKLAFKMTQWGKSKYKEKCKLMSLAVVNKRFVLEVLVRMGNIKRT